MEYNQGIKQLDELYSGLVPNGKVLVRCYHLKTTRSSTGIIIPPQQLVPVPTENGYGYVEVADSPWKFDTRAVIVSSYNPNVYVPGTEVQLAGGVLKAHKRGKEFAFSMPYAFTHYSYGHLEPPRDISSPHYGYHLIPSNMIEVFLPDDKTQEQ